jgi:hypothetical protein
MLRSPRSTEPIKVRCRSHHSANSASVEPRASWWASRKVRYLLNGQAQEQSLTPEQTAELGKEAKTEDAK